jgi:beta-aspartyl-peptidase (threonine type)
MEDSPLFNAARGAVLCADGTIELSASIMCGSTQRAGAVALVKQTKNPISLARVILEDATPHLLLAGTVAERLGRQYELPQVGEDYFRTDRQASRWAQQRQAASASYGTVGAVALDLDGNLGAATSTGGTFRQPPGRIGDSAIIGAGTYAANDSCAVSCTGMGEEFIRAGAALAVADRMRYGGAGLPEAAAAVIGGLSAHDEDTGGLIAVGANGEIAMPFNTEVMFRGWSDRDGTLHTGVA